MKLFSCFSIFLLFATAVIAQSKKDLTIYSKDSSLKYEEVALLTKKGEGYLDKAGGFFVKKNGKFYLVSCYHVIAGYTAYDTNKIHSQTGLASDHLLVVFHSKKGLPPILETYSLYDKNHNRNFLSFGLASSRLSDEPRETTDIAILPLLKIPPGAVIYPVTMDPPSTRPPYTIHKGAALSIWGFKGGRTFDGQFCGVDTVTVDQETKSDLPYLYFNFEGEFAGNSGGAVYLHNKKGKAIFVGMESSEITRYNRRRGVIITRHLIQDIFNKYIP